MVLGALLEDVRNRYGAYDLVAHWKRGELHHDVVVRLQAEPVDRPRQSATYALVRSRRSCRSYSTSIGHANPRPTPCVRHNEGVYSVRWMSTLSLKDGPESFDVTMLEAAEPSRLVLFAVGAGGNPERHLPLLISLAEVGCTVVAPHFERLVSPRPTDGDLLLRARRLSLALEAVARPALPVAGVGHSIGSTMLVALAGGQVWMGAGHRLAIAPHGRLDRLALFAPATGFFQAPGALDAVRTPILAWAGTRDVITPPAQAEFLKHALGERVPVEVRIAEGAGHFSFMNLPPPQSTEPLADREAFLADLAIEVRRFVTAPTAR